MRDDSIKNNWDNLGDFSGISRFSKMSPEQFLRSRSNTIYGKIRSTIVTDLVLKSIFALVIVVDIIFYSDLLPVIAIMACLSVLLILTCSLEVFALREFARISDPGQSSRDNLSSMLTYLQRKAIVPVISMAATQIIIFISGLLFYFYIFYGYLKPISIFSFFVFGTLCLIGFITSLVINSSQIKYHIRHLEACLSDLNENSLAMVCHNIEEKRKQDATIKFLLGIVIVFGFIALLVILKGIIT
jgi:hypothetical protein